MIRKISIATIALTISGCSTIHNIFDRNQSSTELSEAVTTDRFPFAPPSARIEPRTNGATQAELDAPTQVVILGTGTPVVDAYRAGSSIAVIHRGRAFLFDIGSGAVRRALEARYKYDIPSLYPTHIEAVFITHMHSDHVMDLPELAHTLWWRRPKRLRAFGPVGLNVMAQNAPNMFATDTEIRLNSVQPKLRNDGFEIEATEIEPGIIFETDGMTVEAFPVPHGDIKPAFGYKVVTDDMSIVISGDTAASKIIREKARGVDLLFHEAISGAGLARTSKFWQAYHTRAHTLAGDVGKIAADAQPKKLVLYHGLFYGTEEQQIVDEAAEYFDGEIMLADDLDIFRANDD